MSKTLGAFEALQRPTRLPWTTHHRHLLPLSRHLKRAPKQIKIFENLGDIVKPNLRIKWWNIVPNDQVRLRKDKTNTLYTVHSINKITNSVFLDDGKHGNLDRPENSQHLKETHYSRCQLFVGNYEFPNPSDPTKPREVRVFAQRMGMSRPFWNPFLHRWDWKRFTTKTTPTVPNTPRRQRIYLLWPKAPPPRIPLAGNYDSTEEVVKTVTYKPPPISPSQSGMLPRIPSEAEFLYAIYNPTRVDPVVFQHTQPPIEVYLERELSNPHSRTKKAERWRAKKEYEKSLLQDFIAAEHQNLNGREKREAEADARWKWKEKLAIDHRDRARERYERSGLAAKHERRAKHKARKQEQMTRRLTELSLQPQPNQVIPTTNAT